MVVFFSCVFRIIAFSLHLLDKLWSKLSPLPPPPVRAFEILITQKVQHFPTALRFAHNFASAVYTRRYCCPWTSIFLLIARLTNEPADLSIVSKHTISILTFGTISAFHTAGICHLAHILCIVTTIRRRTRITLCAIRLCIIEPSNLSAKNKYKPLLIRPLRLVQPAYITTIPVSSTLLVFYVPPISYARRTITICYPRRAASPDSRADQ